MRKQIKYDRIRIWGDDLEDKRNLNTLGWAGWDHRTLPLFTLYIVHLILFVPGLLPLTLRIHPAAYYEYNGGKQD